MAQLFTPKLLFFRSFCLFLLLATFPEHALASIFKDGADFSNNLASDIAPLLSLFGEGVTLQFMSQSTGWADCILLVMAPVGVITILVSAIRVSGPQWLKAAVGRVRESLVTSELEIMSSTSEESCELWNGKGIVKCQGASSICELLCIYSTKTADQKPKNDNGYISRVEVMDIHRATISDVNGSGYLTKKDAHNGLSKEQLTPNNREKASAESASRNDLESGPSADITDISKPPFGRVLLTDGMAQEKSFESERGKNIGNGTEKPLKAFKTLDMGELIIVRNKDHPAPNLSLNCQADGHRQQIWIYAFISMFIQAVVLCYFVISKTLLKLDKDGQQVDSYAMPLAVAGTFCLAAGLLICSHVVNKSTEETLRQVDRSSCAITSVWLQQKRKVSDQLFKPTALYPTLKSFENVTSGRKEDIDSRNTQRIASERNIALETLTTIGVAISLLGLGAQLTGLRGMHWTAAIIQLAAVLLTVILRAVARLHLAPEIESKRLPPGFELDWFVASVVDKSKPSWLPNRTKDPWYRIYPRGSRTNPTAASTRETPIQELSHRLFVLQTKRSLYSESPSREMVPGNEEYHKKVDDIHTAQGKMDLRRFLGELWQWDSPVSKQAMILVGAIERTLKFFDARFGTSPDVSRTRKITIGTHPDQVEFNFRYHEHAWKASFSELDAALSLWVYSASFIKSANQSTPRFELKGDSLPETLDEHGYGGISGKQNQCMCVQVLGKSVDALDRDLSLWLPTGKDNIRASTPDMVVREDDSVTTRRACSGQWMVQNEEERNNSETESRDGKGSKTEKLPVWWTVESQEDPTNFYARDIFSSFIWALAHRVSLSAHRKKLEAVVQIAENQSLDPVKLKNQDLSRLVQSITELGCWTEREVYLCLIPALSTFKILPGARPVIDLLLKSGMDSEKAQKWEEAYEEYSKLRKFAEKLPVGSHAHWKSLAILSRFNARISQPQTHCFGSQRDDAYESEVLAVVKDKIHDIFEAEKKNLEVHNTLESALHIYTMIPRSFASLDHISLWDPSRETHLWRPEVSKDSEAGACGEADPEDFNPKITENIAYDDGDIFDRTLLHHTMRSNIPTKSHTLPPCELQELARTLKSEVDKLRDITSEQISFSDGFVAAMLDPAIECARLLETGADPSARDLDHWTPLHHACHIVLPLLPQDSNKQLEGKLRGIYFERAKYRAKALLGRKVDVNAQGLDGTTPLHCAAASGCKKLVEYLIKHKANINAQKVDGTTPLQCAAMSGNPDLVKLFLRHQVTETIGLDGRTMLHLVAMTDSKDMFSWIKTSSEVRDRAGRTPLHLSAMSGAATSIRELLGLGAKKNATDNRGRTPLHLVCLYDRHALIEELLSPKSKGELLTYVDPNAKDEQGRTPLHLAALFNSWKAIKDLLTWNDKKAKEYGCDVDFNARDIDGRSPLHLAALSNALDAVKLLMGEHTLNWPPVDEDGQTPFHVAAGAGNAEAIKTMGQIMLVKLDREASILKLQSRADKFTAFSTAAHNGKISCMDAIMDIEPVEGDLSNGALKTKLLGMKDVAGDTPFMDAERNGMREVQQAIRRIKEGSVGASR